VDFPQDYENMLLTVPSNLEDALDLISKLHSKSVMEIETLEQEKQTLEQEKQTLEQEKQTLEQEKQTLEQEKQTLETVLFRTMNSRSWRITKPLRSVVMFIRTMI
jgi:FtsZ-binding cell division protein ZapB